MGIALTRPDWLAPINRAWIKFGETLGKFVTPVVLGILFFGVVTPAALLFRRFASAYSKWKTDPALKSYWIDRAPSASAEKEAFKYQF